MNISTWLLNEQKILYLVNRQQFINQCCLSLFNIETFNSFSYETDDILFIPVLKMIKWLLHLKTWTKNKSLQFSILNQQNQWNIWRFQTIIYVYFSTNKLLRVLIYEECHNSLNLKRLINLDTVSSNNV